MCLTLEAQHLNDRFLVLHAEHSYVQDEHRAKGGVMVITEMMIERVIMGVVVGVLVFHQ
jgi:hypothetical protein